MLKDKKILICIVTALAVIVMMYLKWGISRAFFSYVIVTVFLAIFSVQDIKEKKISNKTLLFMFAAAVVTVGASGDVRIYISSVVSCIVMFLLMNIMYLISMRNLGYGDVKLITVISFIIGFTAAVQLVFMTLLLTVVCGLVLVALKKCNLKMDMPMTPYMFAALLVDSILFTVGG